MTLPAVRHDLTSLPARTLGRQDDSHNDWTYKTGSVHTRRLLAEGFIVGLTNPKTIAFFVAVLPQFVDPTAGPVWMQLLLLGLVFEALALASDSIWALAAGTARAWFARSPRRISTLSATGGVMMIGLGGALALTGSKS